MKSLRKDKGSGNNTDKFRRKLKRKRIYYSLLVALFCLNIALLQRDLAFRNIFILFCIKML